MVSKEQAQECVNVCKWLVSLNRETSQRSVVTLREVIAKAEKALGK